MTQLATPAAGQVVAQEEAPVTPVEQPLIAGKYKDEAAFFNGLNEIRGARGLPKLNTVGVGEGKPYAKIDDAVAEYSKLAGGQIQPASTFKDEDGFDAILTAAGLKPEELQNAFIKDGKLADAHYAAIKKAVPGVTKAMIDGQFKTAHELAKVQTEQRAKATEAVIADVYGLYGGKDQYESAFKATFGTLNADHQKDLARRLDDPMLALGAARELKAIHEAAHGPKSPAMVMGGLPAPAGPATTAEEHLALRAAARRGDAAAQARVNATPLELIESWQAKGR